MELRISTTDLQKTLTLMQGVVQRKNTMPILANVLIEASLDVNEAGILSMSGTDLDTGMKSFQSCEVFEPGTITVSAKSLLDIVKVLPGPSVSLKLMPNQQIQIRSSHTQASLFALSADEFPVLPGTDDLQWYEFEVGFFSEMIQRTVYAASTDENRYNLTGVYFEPQPPSQLAMVATDGHRLSKMEKSLGDHAADGFSSAILPKKGLGELMRLLENQQVSDSKFFELAFSDKQVFVRRGTVLLSMRLIDGQFPDYHQVIPKLADKILRTSKNSFLTSVKRVSVLASDKNQCIKFSVAPGELNVSCVNPEAGEVKDSIPVEYSGPEVDLGCTGALNLSFQL